MNVAEHTLFKRDLFFIFFYFFFIEGAVAWKGSFMDAVVVEEGST